MHLTNLCHWKISTTWFLHNKAWVALQQMFFAIGILTASTLRSVVLITLACIQISVFMEKRLEEIIVILALNAYQGVVMTIHARTSSTATKAVLETPIVMTN